MGCTVNWRPLGNGHSVGGAQLRDALERRLRLPCHVDRGDIDYLAGLDAGGVDGAAELIEAIEKHGTVDIYLR